jgi:hypothetical protein
MSILGAKKGVRLSDGRAKVIDSSVVANTILLKQTTPMLRTNGSAAARERYADELGGLCVIPARQAADRIPFGVAKFTVHYRFAG